MNKIFNKFLIGVLFLLGIILIPTFKVEAGVVTITANGSSSGITVKSGDNIHIVWKALWATSCTNNFNSSTLFDDYADITASATKTFTVNCSSPDTVRACYEGFWGKPDPAHPTGGQVTYMNSAGNYVTRNNIWVGDNVAIDYKVGTTPTVQWASEVPCN